MKIVFFGTPEIAAFVLERLFLEKEFQVVAVVTKIDKPQGRSQKVLPTPVKQFMIETKPSIPLLQPEKVSTSDWEERLRSFGADVFVVVAYGEILKQNILDIPRLGAINVHASLLPKYRGAAPMHRAIIEGEEETGVTIMEMVLALDAGAILDVEKIEISPEMTVGELHDKMAHAGARALIRTLKHIDTKKRDKREQNHREATYAGKITSDECLVCWEDKTKKIYDKIRGVTPWPGAFCFMRLHGEIKRVKLIKVAPLYGASIKSPGSIIKYDHAHFYIATCDGAIAVNELQVEGKKKMDLQEFFNGNPEVEIIG